MVNDGASQTFTVAPDAGSTIADVVADGGSIGAVSTHAFNAVAGDHTIAASFASAGNTGFAANQAQTWVESAGGTTLYGLRGPSPGGGLAD